MLPIKIISHSKSVIRIAAMGGWHAGARYTNYRDIKHLNKITLIDIDFKKYCFDKHLEIVKIVRPFYTIARDVFCLNEISQVIKQANILKSFSQYIIFVPKVSGAISRICSEFTGNYVFGYSVPSRYGGTDVPLDEFQAYPVHLLGGRPEKQRLLAEILNVVSIDGNRLTIDARFGDYFDKEIFRPHPKGGFETCITDSINNINFIWDNYNSLQSKTFTKKFLLWQAQMTKK